MQIKGYLDDLLNETAFHPFIISKSFSFEERPPDAASVTGLIIFIDGSRLYFKEIMIVGSDVPHVLKYGYNYVDRDNMLIFRYDNALDPNAKKLPTYPCHKHLVNELLPSDKPSFEDVLSEIADSIKLT